VVYQVLLSKQDLAAGDALETVLRALCVFHWHGRLYNVLHALSSLDLAKGATVLGLGPACGIADLVLIFGLKATVGPNRLLLLFEAIVFH
jgi:hypothetical protein